MITVMQPASEMGQGVMTVLPVILAEELDVDWRKVKVVQSPDDAKIYGNPVWGNTLTTFGSGTVLGYYDKLRLAGAQARKVLLVNAAQRLNLPVAELATENGTVIHKKSGKKITYAALAKTAQVPNPMPEATKDDLKSEAAFRYLGKDTPRVDVPLKVNGTARYGMDTELPNMLYAAVLLPPVEGEKPEAVDDSAAKAVKGITAITPMPFGVAVVGSTVEATKKAKALLKVTWSTNAQARSYTTSELAEDYRKIAADRSVQSVAMVKNGDADAAISGAAKVMTAEYINDHVTHATMEPMNATAVVKGDQVEVWCSNQSPTNMKFVCAKAAGTSPDKVKVNTPFLGGGFGRRSEGVEVGQAVAIAKLMPGTPVKLIYSREDDVTTDLFRPFSAQRIEVGLDAAGNIVGWRHRVVCPGVLARSSPETFERFGGKDVVAAGGGGVKYALPAQSVEWVRAERGIAVGAWRGISAGYMSFAVETMIDEIARAKGADPVAFRLDLLKDDPRAVKVLQSCAEMAEWGKRKLQAGHALGVAFTTAVGGYQAAIVEVSLDRAGGAIGVHNVWATVDCGRALQPLNIEAQMEGSIVFALGAALSEHIDMVKGEVQQSNFNQYKVMRMADVPPIHIKVISTDNKPTGMGEAGIPAPGPAIANAVATLTGGKRMRQLPMSPTRVKAVLSA